jgi:hypothetical protein
MFVPVYRLQGALGSSSPNTNLNEKYVDSEEYLSIVNVAAMFVSKAKDGGAPLNTIIQMR